MPVTKFGTRGSREMLGQLMVPEDARPALECSISTQEMHPSDRPYSASSTSALAD